MSWGKYVLYGLLALLIAGGALTYYALKSIGIIPRAIYEEQGPELPSFDRPAILVLSKANGYVHTDAIPAGESMLERIANDIGWDIYRTNNAATHNPADLAKFKVVVWNNVSGDVLTVDQRAALKSWLAQGGGWVGLHASGGDPSYKWDWYVNTLVGAQFVGHTMDPQFQDAHVLVADSGGDMTGHLASPWVVPQEEWYAFDSNPRDKGYEILLTLDESSYITRGSTFLMNDRMEGEHPITWRHQIGRGRAFYSAIGHQAVTYDNPAFEKLIANAVKWAAQE